MEVENNKLGYTDIHEDVVRSIVVTGPKYYAALATAGGLALLCFFFPWFLIKIVQRKSWENRRSCLKPSELTLFIF